MVFPISVSRPCPTQYAWIDDEAYQQTKFIYLTPPPQNK